MSANYKASHDLSKKAKTMKLKNYLYIVLFISFVVYFYPKQKQEGGGAVFVPWHRLIRPLSWLGRIHQASNVLHCGIYGRTTCQSSPRRLLHDKNSTVRFQGSCPRYFKCIHGDMDQWKVSGIAKENVMAARDKACFRVTIVDGQLYTELYKTCTHSRALFTLWGILMLLKRFPRDIPDVDLMINCLDRPQVRKTTKKEPKAPVLLGYCTDEWSSDIPLPDWSYWGWPELDIGAWEDVSEEIIEGSRAVPWRDRISAAQWKGNPWMANIRRKLLACNTSEEHGLIYNQNWIAESRDGFKNSKLSTQCGYRYKIYAEGVGWSVSLKYILACGSTVLRIQPRYMDFFMRGLLPWLHYVPVKCNVSQLCNSIKRSVEWGDSKPDKAELIGNQGQDFVKENLHMDRVYDFMFHLFREYAKLQRFQPTIPAGATLLCPTALECLAGNSHAPFLQSTIDPAKTICQL